jgi:uncharacterized membrane protein
MDIAGLTTIVVGLAAGVAVLAFTIVGLIMTSGPIGHDYMMERRGMLGKMFAGLFIIAGAAWIVGLVIQ